jgi:hypothetical protein
VFVNSFVDDLPYTGDVEVCMEFVVWYKPGTFAVVLRTFDSDICMIATLDFLPDSGKRFPFKMSEWLWLSPSGATGT